MQQKKAFEKTYGRHSSFRPARDSGSKGLMLAALLLAAILPFLVVQAYERIKGRGAGNLPAEIPNIEAQPLHDPVPRDREPAAALEDDDSGKDATPAVINVIAPNESGPPPTVSESIAPPATEEPEAPITYVMEMTRSNSFVGQGSINGRHVTLLADTGATHVVVPEKIAQGIGLKKGIQIPFLTAGGKVIHFATKLDTLTLGRIEIRDVAAVINPAMREDFVLLGMSALGLMEVQLDQRKLVLKYRPKHVPGAGGRPAQVDEPFKRTVKECVAQGNKFDKSTLACLRGE